MINMMEQCLKSGCPSDATHVVAYSQDGFHGVSIYFYCREHAEDRRDNYSGGAICIKLIPHGNQCHRCKGIATGAMHPDYCTNCSLEILQKYADRIVVEEKIMSKLTDEAIKNGN